MNLTPLDIRRKEFDKGFRGYDPTEVDLFLKQAADRLEELQEDARRAEERTREAEAKLVHYEKVELALQEALESARESARRSEASAEEKARLIVQEAELRAETIVRDAERERYALRQDVSKLSARQAEIAARLRGFLFSELEVLAQFQGDDPVGFIKLQPAGAHTGSAPSQGVLGPPPARLEAPIADPETEPEGDRPTADAPEPSAPEPDTSARAATDTAPEPSAPAPLADAPLADAPAEAPASSESEPSPEPAPPVEPAGAHRDDAPPAQPEREASDSESMDEDKPDDGEPSEDAVGSPAEAPDELARADAPEGTPPAAPPAVTGGWDLRSLVTGGERTAAASDQEREAIRRILDDLD